MLKHNTARTIMRFLVDENDHVTGLAGLTLAIEISKNGAAFGSISPVVTDRGDGWYAIELTAGHTDTLGDLAFHIEATGADPLDFVEDVVPRLPGEWATQARSELGAVPAANASLAEKVDWMFMVTRNKITQNATTQAVRDDGDTTDVATAPVSDVSGVTTRGQYTS